MPGGNGKGPSGMGTMTGRKKGYCADYSAPGYFSRNSMRKNPMQGFSCWGVKRNGILKNDFYSQGFGNTFGRETPGYGQNMDPEFEKEMLVSHKKRMESELEYIDQRLNDMHKQEPDARSSRMSENQQKKESPETN